MADRSDAASIVTALYEARASGDIEAMRDLLHPEVVWREHEGDAAYAGVHVGRDAVVEGMLASALAATNGTFVVHLEGVVGFGPALAAALVRWSAECGGTRMSGREVGVYRVRDGKVAEASFQLEDPGATDAFFAAGS